MPSRDLGRTPRHAFGAVLRHYRERAGLTRPELAARVHKSASLIQAIELGERVATEDVTADLDGVAELRTDGILGVLRAQFRDSLNYHVYPAWFADWPGKEAAAAQLRWFEPSLVPGLLQTEDYARAIFRSRFGAGEEEIEEQVAARMRRQDILARSGPPRLWVVLDEFVLRRPVGGPHVMREQVGRLIDAARQPHVMLQVIPASVGAHLGLLGQFVIADFGAAPSVGYQDAALRGQPVEEPDDVASLVLTWDSLRGEALPRAASQGLLEEAAKAWTLAMTGA